MTLKNLIFIIYIIILLLLVIIQIRNHKKNDTASTVMIFILAAFVSVIALFPWVLPEEVANTQIKYLNGHVTIDQLAKSDESTLAVESFQVTGDSTKGIAFVKLHVTSNFYLLNGSITVYRGGDLEPVTVGYHIPSSTCLSTTSAKNFGIRFEEMVSGETYSAEVVAEDISGNKITETTKFTAY